ncbi:MAG: type II toxin-antitoxin system HicA family toxin [Deltaproteobacteria bacterium]
MPRIIPVHWKVLECIFLMAGFVFARQKGDHRIYTKDNCLRPIVIPTYKEVDQNIIQPNIRSAGMTHDTYLQYFEQCK